MLLIVLGPLPVEPCGKEELMPSRKATGRLVVAADMKGRRLRQRWAPRAGASEE